MELLNRNWVGLTVFVSASLLLMGIACAQQVQILSPPDGTIVRPGQTIDVTIAPGSSGLLLLLSSDDAMKISTGTSPGGFVLNIPLTMPSGVYYLTAIGDPQDIDRISINVETADSPTSIQISPTWILFDRIGEEIPIQILGMFTNGNEVNLTHSTNTSFEAANTQVATVTEDGLVTAVAPGSTSVAVTYGSISSSILVQVPPKYTVPWQPTGVSATAGNAQATVNFTDPAKDGNSPIISYTVISDPEGNTGIGSSSPIVVVGLTNGAAYTFTVAANNAVGVGPASHPSNSVTPKATLSVPGAPTEVTAKAGNAQATVNFTPPAADGGSAITSYTVTSSPGDIKATGASSPITVTGLSNGTTYTFTVTATNAIGPGPASSGSNPVTPAASGYSVSGTVACAGTGVSGVTVNLTGAATKTTSTDSSGNYSFSGLSNGSYTITPSKANYAFTPTKLSVTVASANASGKNFTAITKPGAPTGVSATAGDGEATVTFTAPASNGGSAITFYTVTSSPANIPATGSASPIAVTGLTNGTTYTFTVTATNAAGTGPESSSSNPVTPMASGYSLSGTVTCAGTGVSGVAVNLTGAATKSTTTDSIGSYSFTGLANGSYTITPGKSNYTFTPVKHSVTVTGGNVGAKNFTASTKPDPPTGVTAEAGSRSAKVIFTPPAFNGGSAITSYTVTSIPGGKTAKGEKSPITVKKLTNGTTYAFTVTATNKVGTGGPSLPSNPVTPAAKPGKPTGVTATAGIAEATVSFTAPASDGGSPITSYQVISSPGNRTVNGTASPITVTGLANGRTYTFTVKAINAIGTGPASAKSNPLKPATVPGKPTGVKATADNARATVSFTAPGSDGGSAITAYTVTSSPGNITATGTKGPISVTGLTNGTAYTFTVTASNKMGTGTASSPSKPVTPATKPGAPAGVAAVAGNAKATVSFGAPASDGGSTITSYIVISSPGGIKRTGTGSPITVPGLTNGTAYTFTVKARNAEGVGLASSPSNRVTPAAGSSAALSSQPYRETD